MAVVLYHVCVDADDAWLCVWGVDEFEDEGILEKSLVKEKSLTKVPHVKSDVVSPAGETSAGKEPRKESRKISVSAMEPRKRVREDEEYIPQPVRSVLIFAVDVDTNIASMMCVVCRVTESFDNAGYLLLLIMSYHGAPIHSSDSSYSTQFSTHRTFRIEFATIATVHLPTFVIFLP